MKKEILNITKKIIIILIVIIMSSNYIMPSYVTAATNPGKMVIEGISHLLLWLGDKVLGLMQEQILDISTGVKSTDGRN